MQNTIGPKGKVGIDLQSHSGDPIELEPRTDLYGYLPPARLLAITLLRCATPLVVGIYGRWGRGKSTFMNTLKNEISNLNKDCLHHTYSPWHYHLSNFEDVWLSLITEFANEQEGIGLKLSERVKEINYWKAAKEAIKFGAYFLPMGTEAAKKVADLVPDSVKDKNEFDQFIQTKKTFDEAISSYMQNNKNGKVIIYIDDIDRCEPKISVFVLRAIQVLCRNKNCIFLLGLDRDVIVKNLSKVYDDDLFAREYLDKIVQLHIELPRIEFPDLQASISWNGDGKPRDGIEPFARWIATTMDYNPRKIERFVFLYDHKLQLQGKLPETDQNKFQVYKQTVLFTALDLKWPHISGEIAKTTQILDAIQKLGEAANMKAEESVVVEYEHLPIVERIHRDRGFILAYRQIEGIQRKRD
ncbi:MAG: hypothetical protein IH859_09220 [Chloroflexi bacterium]|nr:hypothetical protein [Chloroflexota bacterium]